MRYWMKHGRTTALSLALFLALCLLPGTALAQETGMPVGYEAREMTEIEGNFVRWPEFTAGDAAFSDVVEKINLTIQEGTSLPAYQALLSALSPGGTGLRMDYEMTLSADYLFLLFSAEGRMPAGRPGQAYYPMTFDLATGEPVPFDALFADPEGAKAFIEEYLEWEVEPTLSTYLENNQLFPVPYDRYFLDGYGNVIFCYPFDQLSFLSGFSGTVAFRYSELWDYLDTSAEGVPMRAMQWGTNEARYIPTRKDFSLGESMDEWMSEGAFYGLIPAPYLTAPLEDALSRLRATTDSGSYPGGAYYEVEEARLRGTLILTDEAETVVTGLLTSRVDQYGIETGKTTLDEAEKMLARAGVRIPIPEAAAEIYHVCPGTALIYTYRLDDVNDPENPYNGWPVSFTLYADESGVVQYIKLALEN